MTTDASRFYYLRLMAKREGGQEVPVGISRPKFVQWGSTRRISTSLEENPELEVRKAWALGNDLVPGWGASYFCTIRQVNLQQFFSSIDALR